jgi:hypothetical protein
LRSDPNEVVAEAAAWASERLRSAEQITAPPPSCGRT